MTDTLAEIAPTWIEQPNRQPLLRGVHHLAINTDDLKTTLDFYVRVLGMPLVHGLTTGSGKKPADVGNPPFPGIPHFFVDMGGDSLLAFFEYPKGSVARADRNSVGAMQHCSFVCGPQRFVEMQDRLARNGVKIVYGPSVVIPPNVQSIYFFDPIGVRLEISADMDGSAYDLQVVRSSMSSDQELRRELAKVSPDPDWIDSIMQNTRENEQGRTRA